jgi:hypothetical protein
MKVHFAWVVAGLAALSLLASLSMSLLAFSIVSPPVSGFRLRFYVANLQRLVLGAMIKVVVGKKQRRRAFLVNPRQGLEHFAKVIHPMEVMEFKWQDSIPCAI